MDPGHPKIGRVAFPVVKMSQMMDSKRAAGQMANKV